MKGFCGKLLTEIRTNLFLTEERDEIVKFLWGNRVAEEGAGEGAGWDVRGRRVPAAAAPAASTTTNHHLYITGTGTNATRLTVTLASYRLAVSYSPPTTFTFVVPRSTTPPAAARPTTMKAKAFTTIRMRSVDGPAAMPILKLDNVLS